MLYTIKQVALGNESGLNFLCCSHKCKRQLENIYSWTPSITYDRTTVQRVCDSTKVIEWLHGELTLGLKISDSQIMSTPTPPHHPIIICSFPLVLFNVSCQF